MPTIKTIKPAGGGDYTTLQSWWTFASAQASADQWAECYAGDLGKLSISGTPSFTADSTHYPKIYAASGNQFTGGFLDTSKAYIQLPTGTGMGKGGTGIRISGSAFNFGQIVGIQVNYPTAGKTVGNVFQGGVGIQLTDGASSYLGTITIDQCMFLLDTGSASNGGGLQLGTTGPAGASVGVYISITNANPGPPPTSNILVTNCVAIQSATGSGAGNFAGFYSKQTSSYSNTTVKFYNLTAYGKYGFYCYTQTGGNGGTPTLPIYNCVAGATTTAFTDEAGNGTRTADYNCSSDTTLPQNDPSTHSLKSKSTSTLFTNTASDMRPPGGSPVLNAGTNLTATFTDDVLNVTRPSSGAWDMGAYQISAGGGGTPVISPYAFNQAMRMAMCQVGTMEGGGGVVPMGRGRSMASLYLPDRKIIRPRWGRVA